MYFKKVSGQSDVLHNLDILSEPLKSLNLVNNEKYDLVYLDLILPTNFIQLNGVQINWRTLQGMSLFSNYIEEMLSTIYNKLTPKGLLVIPINMELLGTVLNLSDKIFSSNNKLGLFTVIHSVGTSGSSIVNNKTDYVILLSKNKSMVLDYLESPYGVTGDYIHKDLSGKYKYEEISVEKGGHHYDLRYSGEKVHSIYSSWKYPKDIVEQGLDTRFFIRRWRKKLYIYEKEYLQEFTRPNNVIELTQNTNISVIENLYEVKTVNKLSIDVILYFIRMVRSNNLNILSLNDEDGLLHYVVDWENRYSQSRHHCTVMRNGTNNDLVSRILNKSKLNTVVLESINSDITLLDDIVYELQEGKILLKNPHEPLYKTDISKVSELIKSPLKHNTYIKTSDQAIINELRKILNSDKIYGIEVN